MHPFLPFFSRIVLLFSFRCKNMIDLSIISVKEMSRIKEVEKTVQMVMDWEWICSIYHTIVSHRNVVKRRM